MSVADNLQLVKKEIKNEIVYITINRPPVNALNRQLYKELEIAFGSVFDDVDKASCVIFTAEGKQFIAGNDLNEEVEDTKYEANLQSLYFANTAMNIYNCPIPVIGAINGAAVGAGFCYAALCDVLVAADTARFGVTETKVGLLGALAFLPSMVPDKLGKYMSLTGELVPAQKLEAYGSVHKVVPRDQLLAAAEEVAEKIKLIPPEILKAWKRTYLYIDPLDFCNIEHITDMFIDDVSESYNANEARRAFLEKRKPVYRRK